MNFPYRNIVVLTGAGISAESGIQTFRAQDGLWENHRIEDVATPEGFAKDPDLVQDFYNQRRKKTARPQYRTQCRTPCTWPTRSGARRSGNDRDPEHR